MKIKNSKLKRLEVKMKKIKKILKNKKNLPFIIGGILLIIITISTITILVSNAFKDDEKKLSEEEKITLNLEEMGREFYEKNYQPYMTKDVLSKFKDIGIKFYLSSLIRVNAENNPEKVNSFVNSETKEECDKEGSMVIVYPQEPYGEKDYRIETILVCGFDKK